MDKPAKSGGLSAPDQTQARSEQPTPEVQATLEIDPAKSERVVARPGMTRATKLTLLAALWVVTAAIPALIVWRVMRTSNDAVAIAQKTLAYHARAAADTLAAPVDRGAAPREDQAAPATGQGASPDAITTATASSEGSAAPSNTSEALPAEATTAAAADPSIPTAIETESNDRVSVLVRSKPDHARVLRRGKEIGRTPLVIQIGRGERRVFEVAAHGFGAKRVSIDGDKPEILVNMAGDAKAPGTVFLPAPLPEKKYERLR
ncbi:MAG TPA: hypothetical protein VKP30_11465 [Polyangiaceae bacterium]|nr:hypothetical protein [Polyangiaceae bacterium]